MHCEACAQALQKRVRKIKGVESVETDLANSHIIVKGVIDPTKLVDDVYKKTRKQAFIVKDDQEKKEEERKEEEKKEEKEQEKKDGEEGKGEDVMSDIKRNEYLPSKFYLEYAYAPEFFSDENPNACFVM
ncbi:hypothetical protein GH714_010887 [Hevea brasiliensis]|uniref:HMA domain-containing protein n=1 Tax=Hevea brasiliensis TaxID=3981 RepID=A0A6A6M2A3_HEVBR|nr:hypothetical protein GH714_010887 [Hevea brasiliensis]